MIITNMKLQKSSTLENSLWEKIDIKRGDVSRSRFCEKILKKSFDGEIKNDAK